MFKKKDDRMNCNHEIKKSVDIEIKPLAGAQWSDLLIKKERSVSSAIVSSNSDFLTVYNYTKICGMGKLKKFGKNYL
jgi:hypothetical protein